MSLASELGRPGKERVMKLTRVWASGWVASMGFELVLALLRLGGLRVLDGGGLA